MSLTLVQSEDFLLDLEQQFEWYVHESKLDLADAIELAQKFKIAVHDTLEFLHRHPGAGRRRFPPLSLVHRLARYTLMAREPAI